MKILLLGETGQLGWELNRTLATLGPIDALDYPQFDLSQPETLRNVIPDFKPKVIVNAAAYTAVDQAEMEPEKAMAINGRAPGILAELANKHGAVLIHYSTDYVFDGQKGAPYVETDAPNPLNMYGKTKLVGEQAVSQVGKAYLIFRTSWVYSTRRDCFVTKIMQLARTIKTLSIVTDQVGSPTWARMLAEITAQVLARASADKNSFGWIRDRKGIYHLAGEGWVTRFDLAEHILKLDPKRQEHRYKDIRPARSSDFPSPARRPAWSALNCEHFKSVFDLNIPGWKESLELALGS